MYFPSTHSSDHILLGLWFAGPKDEQENKSTRLQRFLKPCTEDTCACSVGPKYERAINNTPLQCKAVLKPLIEKYKDVFQHTIGGKEALEENAINKIKENVNSIRSILGSMNDGEISVSAYDTAWVALVENINGNGGPQFPTSLDWIANNQLPDGSWGESSIFQAHDRLLSTLACVIALKSWNTHSDKTIKGMEFIKDNMRKLEDANEEHMPVGFEVTFPALIEIGRKLDIELFPVEDFPVLQEIYAKRNLKLKRIPKEKMHNVPTSLLFSLEGMTGLDWKKLLKLQSPDGSFCNSLSSTAFALMQTKDDNCLRYLSRVVEKFNGGVPHSYPVALFERLWAIDRLKRLGISRYFLSEIKESLNYVNRYWTEEGIFSVGNSIVTDIDCSAMGFRLLRLHGYHVRAGVFQHFEKGGEFFCISGQSTQGITAMYNLYRASQVLFPGEKILEDAKKFSSKFLREKQASNKLLDKWVIAKDLPGEVGYALEVSWYANLPRVETRFYLDQYGGEDDVWIGKTLYRMPNISNNKYLELAKLDYNYCQALHLLEWDTIQKWYTEYNLEKFAVSKKDLLFAYYLATASIFEPERAKERLAWAQTKILMEAIASSFKNEANDIDQSAFLHEFRNHGRDYVRISWDGKIRRGRQHGLAAILLGTLDQLLFDAHMVQDREIRDHLHQAWEMWIMTWQEEGDMQRGEAELLVSTINLCAYCGAPKKLSQLSHPRYKHLSGITNGVCYQLLQFLHQQCHEIHYQDDVNTTLEIESAMQELVQLVVCASSDDIGSDIKQTFFTVARSYYYVSHFTPATIEFHIAKVLFERAI